MAELEKHTLRVGEALRLERGLPIFEAQYAIIYAGMPGPAVFSVVVMHSIGNSSLAYNLFNPAGRGSLQVADGTLEISEVTPDHLSFRYLA